MKNLIFNDLCILSRKERKALNVIFHPQSNLIVGRNHTGKSSILQTLFITLGAKTNARLKRWDEDAISAVSFSVDGVGYFVVRDHDKRALFTREGELIDVVSGISKWANLLNRVMEFNLILADKNAAAVEAPPSCLFLPFYIDQDGSWGNQWNTFEGLSRFKQPTKAILEYFTGIKPPEYYTFETQRRNLKAQLEELQAEAKFLGRARSRVSTSLSATTPKLSPENFERDIQRLTTEVSSLNSEQERLRSIAVREHELIKKIEAEIAAAAGALVEHSKDFNYLMEFRGDTLLCPTCGTEHKQSFVEIIEIADDARILQELVFKLQRDLEVLYAKHSKTRMELASLQTKHRAVDAVLETKRGELTFSEVVSSLSAETAMKVFDEEWERVERETSALRMQIKQIEAKLKELSNKVRTAHIVEHFHHSYHNALIALNLPLLDAEKPTLLKRPNLSGSTGPRAVLAYYSAIWAASAGRFGTFRMPLVINSPNQQGQDAQNLPKILEFIHSGLPKGNQVIVASEIEPSREFHHKIELTQPYSVLSESEFATVEEMLAPFLIKLRTYRAQKSDQAPPE